jgi:hypothetical protein
MYQNNISVTFFYVGHLVNFYFQKKKKKKKSHIPTGSFYDLRDISRAGGRGQLLPCV